MKIHFIGIGGIGVSALAKYYLKKDWEVSGCDLASSEITDQLKSMGIAVRIGKPDISCVPENTDRVVYSPAVPEGNIERKKKKAQSYPEALGELTRTHYTVAVSGTHGKSTTTSMIGLLLVKAGYDPTIIVGTKLKELGDSNCRVAASERGEPRPAGRGKSKYLVIEADEHLASFLNYWPTIIVLTTVEADHLDYWKNLQNLLKGFQKYISHLPQNGVLVANKDDKNIRKLLSSKNNHFPTAVGNRIYWFSLKQKEGGKLRKTLKIPGEHNVANALAALTVARVLKIPDRVSLKALSEYKGSWRRFEIFNVKCQKSKVKIVSDYGHHPTEIRVTVKAAREKWPKKKIWLVFQPHQYARTYYLWNDFVKVLSQLPVEKLIITDVYDVAGRENKALKAKVSSEKLARATGALHIPTVKQAEQYLKQNLRGGEIVMIMGAGDIYGLTLRLRSG
ncbi:MAG: UDP-N-acetylmuramate--L-alanine ligase [Candidatus Wildermuthbacteria bacterium]|nr:UDP-N-acetylmuramate--L-alanine ligase [Candidatus Wildermuthbacteria bacterium]